MGLRVKALQGSAANTLRSVIETLLALGSFVVFARYLSPSDFGVYALASAVLAFGEAVNDLGFRMGIVQAEELNEPDRTTAFWSILAVSTGAMVLIMGASPLLGRVFGQDTLAIILPIMSFKLLLDGFSDVPRALLQRDLEFVYISVCSFLGTALAAGGGILMALQGWGVWSLVFYRLAVPLVGSIGFWLRVRWFPGWAFRVASFQQLANFGSRVLGKKLLERAGNRVDDLLIGYFLGSHLLGFFVIAYRVANLTLELVLGPFLNVAVSMFSRLQSELDRLRSAFYTCLRLTALAAYPVLFLMVLLAPRVVELVFGTRWDPSVPVLQILLLSGVGLVVCRYISRLLVALGRPDYDLYGTVLETGLLLSLIVAVVHQGLLAVALVCTLVTYLVLPVLWFLTQQVLGLSMTRVAREISHPFLGSTVMAGGVYAVGAIWMVQLDDPEAIFTGTALGAGVYLIYFLVLAPERISEFLSLGKDLWAGRETRVLNQTQKSEPEP